jgi:exonuclease VII small subunit
VVLDGYAAKMNTRLGVSSGQRWDTEREKIGELIMQLELQRTRLEQVRMRARRQGGPEGERLEAQATARLQEIEQRINNLWSSLG